MFTDKIVLGEFPDESFPENLKAFKRIRSPVRELEDREVLIKVRYISIDPVARVWVSGAKTYLPAIKIGGEVPGFGIGAVVLTKSHRFQKGDLVTGVLSWSSHVIRRDKEVFPIPSEIERPYRFLSIFGPTGLTAYMAIQEEMSSLPRDINIVVSSAAGATGIAFIQYARAQGFTRIVGIAGSDDKCQLVRQLGCLNSVNYKTQRVSEAVVGIFPSGVDLYFDNIGEEMLAEMLLCMKNHSKVVLCGATATYARWKSKSGVANIFLAITKRITLRGILYFGQTEKLAMALPGMVQLAEEHGISGHETILKGLDQAPVGLQGVYFGKYTGKAIIDLGDEPAAKL